jgi:hypothetical protein
MKTWKKYLGEVANSGSLYADLFDLITIGNDFRSSLSEVAERYPQVATQFDELEKQALEITRYLQILRKLYK